MVIRWIFRSLVKLAVYVFGFMAIAGLWDYAQQAQAADYDYSFDEYAPSVMARYGDEIGVVSDGWDVAKAGLNSGLQVILDSGILEKLGVDQFAHFAWSTDPTVPAPEPVQVALLQSDYAPETSLFPRARALQ
jgi:hypothetical protein